MIGPNWREELVAFLLTLQHTDVIPAATTVLNAFAAAPTTVISDSATWAAATDIGAMLRVVLGRITPRKLQLLACDLCRLVWHSPTDRRGLRALETAERHADGLASPKELAAAATAARGLPQLVASLNISRALAVAAQHAGDAEACDRVREVLADPFTSLQLDHRWLRWNDGCVGKLLQAIWRGQRFAELPILADALEDAGCEAMPLLQHFRDRRRHCRGCWGLDLLLQRR
jgi:hypothetical protein